MNHLKRFTSQFTIHNSQFIILALITLFAAVIRFYHLATLPPGLWFDEAWVSVAARGNATPAYFAASFGGMHPAVVYLTRLAQTLTNQHPLTIRYALATIGTLTIPLAYLTTTQLLMTNYQSPIPNPKSPILPLTAAFILAILYPFLHFSRLGFESMLPAPAALLAFYLLGRVLEVQLKTHPPISSSFIPDSYRNLSPLSLSLGLALGLCLYTFDTGRFIPLAVALAYWWHAWVNRHQRPLSQAVIPFIIIVIVSIVVAAPLLTFFWQNWSQFTERAAVTTYNTLGPGADSVPLAIGRNIIRTLGGLSLPGWGDGIARHNLPGRPVFDAVLSLFFWLGLITLVRRPHRPLAIILLSWLFFTLLPVILTDGAPTYTRIFGAIPALAITAAFGLTTAITNAISGANTINPKSKIQNPKFFILLTSLLLLLTFSTASTLTDYFIRWPQTPALFDDFQVGQWQAGQLALEKSTTSVTYFVPNLIDDAHPTLELLLRGSAVRPHPAAPCLLYHQTPTQPVTYLIDILADKQMSDTLQQLYPGLETAARIRHQPSGDTIYRLFQINPQSKIQTPKSLTPTSVTFANTIQLTAYELLPSFTIHNSQFTIHNSSTISLTLYWQSLTPPPADYTLFLHLYPSGREDEAPLAQLDAQPCWPTGRWHPDETIRDQHTFQLPADLPPGTYILALGLYTFPTFERLPLTAPAALTLPDQRYILAQFTIPSQ